jgi:small subunit ribosomal protein S1
MSDQGGKDDSGEDFAAMLAADEKKSRGVRRARRAVGDPVRGRVVSVGREVAMVELDGGGEGMLDTAELRDPSGEVTVKAGDIIEARVGALGEKDRVVTLRRTMARGADSHAALEQAVASRIPVEGTITAINKGGAEVSVAGLRAFCPLSQLDLRPVADPAALVGQRFTFRVTRYEDDRRGPNVVLSRRALLEEEMALRAVETRGKLAVGAVMTGVVTAIKDFGAFVDLGGIEGMLPASEITHTRGTRPADVLAVGQRLTVQVTRLEKRDDERRPEQVSLSLKALEADPWDDAVAQFQAGALVRGTVRRTEPFGAFVEIAPGVEGLLHVSELGGGKPLRHAKDAAKPGDALDLVVLSIDRERRRVSLGLASNVDHVDDEGRAAANRAAAPSGLGTLGDLLKGKL